MNLLMTMPKADWLRLAWEIKKANEDISPVNQGLDLSISLEGKRVETVGGLTHIEAVKPK